MNTYSATAMSDVEVSISAGPEWSPNATSVFDMAGSSVVFGAGGDVPIFGPISVGGGGEVAISTSDPDIVLWSTKPSIGVGISPVEVHGGGAWAVPTAGFNIFSGEGMIANPYSSFIGPDILEFNIWELSFNFKEVDEDD